MNSLLYTKAVGKVVEDIEKEKEIETPDEKVANEKIIANVKGKVKGLVQKSLFPETGE